MENYLYKKAKFDWDPDIRMATCEIDMKDDGVFIGTAFCHEDDMDMCSELTGQTIAYFRASIAYYKFLKNNRIKPGLKALNQAYYSMNRSKKFNPDAYETKLLLSQINIYKADLEGIKEAINILEKDLKAYIDVKDEKYKKMRLWRQGSKELADKTE